MATTAATTDLPASPDQVWRLIGGFGSLPDWLPFISASEPDEGGRVRRLTTADGETIVERLERFDDRARSYTYAIVRSPFPVGDYHSTITVYEGTDAGHARVEWSGTFTPEGATDEETVELFHGIYTDGLAALGRTLGT
ncbi:SRPBCC family protein [Streptosporangium sp. NPDC048865]|uniref:SRPBCC family protein n=1 Tax=Streptosporangium sp. NPDC048865 TaxID=3155766 RepID=UPI00343438BA